MDVALSLENVYHEIMLSECKCEEAKQWENARHDLMMESIKDTINYYSKCWRWEEHER